MILPDIKFSSVELKDSILFMVLSAVAGLVIAFITFESEYYTGICIEYVLEVFGILKSNWMPDHSRLFLHFIQILFIITFFFEIKFIILKSTRNWKL